VDYRTLARCLTPRRRPLCPGPWMIPPYPRLPCAFSPDALVCIERAHLDHSGLSA